MEKIVLLTDGAGGNETLIACLHTLFPECEIHVRSESMTEALTPAEELRREDKQNPWAGNASDGGDP